MTREIKTILKYIISAGMSFVIDISLFTLFNAGFYNALGNISIIVSTILARILSSLFNYIITSRVVFKKWNRLSIIKYYVLVVTQMFVSAISVYGLNFIFINIEDTYIKICVDVIIFIVNYIVQKKLIFHS